MGFRHTLAWIPALFRAGDAVKGVLPSRCAPCVRGTHPVTTGAGTAAGRRAEPSSFQVSPEVLVLLQRPVALYGNGQRSPHPMPRGRAGSAPPAAPQGHIHPAAGAGCPWSPPQLLHVGHKTIPSPLHPGAARSSRAAAVAPSSTSFPRRSLPVPRGTFFNADGVPCFN